VLAPVVLDDAERATSRIEVRRAPWAYRSQPGRFGLAELYFESCVHAEPDRLVDGRGAD
jgi:hypothetical protein